MMDCAAYEHTYESISCYAEPEDESILSGVAEPYSQCGPLEQPGVSEPSELSVSSEPHHQSVSSEPDNQSISSKSSNQSEFHNRSGSPGSHNQSSCSEPDNHAVQFFRAPCSVQLF